MLSYLRYLYLEHTEQDIDQLILCMPTSRKERNMKKIIIKCSIFLITLFIILVVLSRIFIPKNNTQQAGIAEKEVLEFGILAEPENTIDVILTGDSESYTSFIPLEAWHKYGFTSYVCGSPAQKLPAIGSILQEALEKQQPKIIMLETNTIYRTTSLTVPIVQVANKVLPVIQYHNRWKSLTQNDFFGKVEYTNVQMNKGFYFSKVVKSSRNKKYMKNSKKVEKIPEVNKIYAKSSSEIFSLIAKSNSVFSTFFVWITISSS